MMMKRVTACNVYVLFFIVIVIILKDGGFMMLLPTVVAVTPMSQHVHTQTTSNTDTIVQLAPYDGDNDPLQSIITALPTVGTLYELAPNYITYGYEPIRGNEITNVPFNVSSAASHRVVYNAPIAFNPTRFEYRSIDTVGKQLSQNYGSVIITKADNVSESNAFNFDNEEWMIVTATEFNASWHDISVGALNRYIYKAELQYVVGVNNNVPWFFRAPLKYRGVQVRAYGGTFSFVIGAFEGDFSETGRYPLPITFVSLHCASCNLGQGITLAQRNVVFNGDITSMSFTLNELPSSGWKIDPRDDRITEWPSPTQCEFISVLNDLSDIRIYGDLTMDHEAVGIDSVQLTTTDDPIPVSCL